MGSTLDTILRGLGPKLAWGNFAALGKTPNSHTLYPKVYCTTKLLAKFIKKGLPPIDYHPIQEE